jgi:hypothetical protein
MAVSDSAKLDYLWKKLGYGVTKTAPPDNKQAFNESIPSPLLYRGDLIWQYSGNIPSVIPAASSNIVTVYKDGVGSFSPTVETTEDLTAPDNRTWRTNLTNWIPTQFGATYLVKVYVANANVSTPQSVGTQLFQAGSGNNDEWYFDYQSGVLNFNGANIPSVIGTGVTGKKVYISGARYTGALGLGNDAPALTVSLIDGANTISNTVTNVEFLRFDANSGFGVESLGNGNVKISLGSTFKTWVVGNSDPGQPNLVASGEDIVQFVQGNGIVFTSNNTPTGNAYKSLTIDVDLSNYTGNITAGNIDVTGNITGANVIANAVISIGNVSGSNIVGILRPTAGNTQAGIIFPNDPGGGSGDGAFIKYYANSGENTVLELNVTNDANDYIYLNATGGTDVQNDLRVTGNVSGNYFLGNGAFLTGLYSNANVANYLPTYTGNITAGNIDVTGNVSANYFLGNGAFLTGLYSNANVAAYLASNANILIATQNTVSANSVVISGSTLFKTVNSTSSTAGNQTIFSIAAVDVKSIDFNIVATDNSDDSRQTSKITAVRSSTNVSFVEYAGLSINNTLGNFRVVYSAPNVELQVSPSTGNTVNYEIFITNY